MNGDRAPALTVDLHLHSTFSVDGRSRLSEMAAAALRAGLRTICFTEHVDHHPRDTGYGFYRYEAYREAVLRAREAFAGRLEILWGIEFSQPHHYPAELAREQARDYDLIIGSQHFLGHWFLGEHELLAAYSREEVFMRYYDELIAMAAHGGFDVMGHIGFPARYLGGHAMPAGIARALATEMARAGIVPEINTSGFRQGYPTTMPDAAFLEQWALHGDGRVTVGSDAHSVHEPGAGLDQAAQAISQFGLRPVVFRQR